MGAHTTQWPSYQPNLQGTSNLCVYGNPPGYRGRRVVLQALWLPAATTDLCPGPRTPTGGDRAHIRRNGPHTSQIYKALPTFVCTATRQATGVARVVLQALWLPAATADLCPGPRTPTGGDWAHIRRNDPHTSQIYKALPTFVCTATHQATGVGGWCYKHFGYLQLLQTCVPDPGRPREVIGRTYDAMALIPAKSTRHFQPLCVRRPARLQG